jgi:hypothetical protein
MSRDVTCQVPKNMYKKTTIMILFILIFGPMYDMNKIYINKINKNIIFEN